MLFFPATTSLNNIIPWDGMYKDIYVVVWESKFWLIVFLCTVTVTLPLALYLTGSELYRPTIAHVARLAGKRKSLRAVKDYEYEGEFQAMNHSHLASEDEKKLKLLTR